MGVEMTGSDLKVEEACRAALLHEFVKALEGGYGVVLVGEGRGYAGWWYRVEWGTEAEVGYY